jgi:tRNA threonylcarbamoyladenosine biosynthesis protein TsaE
MERQIIHDLNEMEKLASEFVRSLVLSTEGATLVTLTGELGAGKTAFVKLCAKVLGVSELITSPTFVIEKRYELSEQKFDLLIHIDAYRLETGKELINLNWQETMKNPKNIIFLEWPQQVAEALPDKKIEFTFTVISEGVREITYDHH